MLAASQSAIANPQSAILEARGLTKRFPGVVALSGVDFTLHAGEIHALCGENGAGKSTLIKLLAGIYPHGTFEGTLLVEGQEVVFRTIRDAEAVGIAVITQELALVDELSVAENIFLGRLPRRGLFVDWLTLHRRTAKLLADFGLTISPEMPVSQLGIGQKQLLEIIRAMDKRSRILVLDEPTAALTQREIDVLIEHLRRLRAQGTACIYISHKLDEVLAIADRITVLRDGASVVTLDRETASTGILIKHMVGREITDRYPRGSPAMQSATTPVSPLPILSVQRLTVARAPAEPAFLRDITFELHAGEIVGIGGLMGAGRTELLLHLFGAWGYRISGNVTLRGAPHNLPTPRQSLARGLALAGEDRRRNGLVLEQDVGFNLSLSSLGQVTRAGHIDGAREHARNQTLFDLLSIKAPGQATRAGTLSGGNQQKVVIGKALMTVPSVVMLDEPTRGIDVGAKGEIYQLIRRLTAEGKGVLLVSSELPELMGMSDRILMLTEGSIGGEFVRGEFSAEALLTAAMGRTAA